MPKVTGTQKCLGGLTLVEHLVRCCSFGQMAVLEGNKFQSIKSKVANIAIKTVLEKNG